LDQICRFAHISSLGYRDECNPVLLGKQGECERPPPQRVSPVDGRRIHSQAPEPDAPTGAPPAIPFQPDPDAARPVGVGKRTSLLSWLLTPTSYPLPP